MSLAAPTLDDIRAAATAIAPHLSLPTPLVRAPALAQELGAEVWLKYEFATPIGAFKVRGGLNLVRSLVREQREAGLVTASTGNHGQSIAYAAGVYGVAAAVFVPEGANPDKVASMRRLGARIHAVGRAFDDSRRAAEEYARETGARYVHVSNEPALLAGVGTGALEVLDGQLPQPDVVIVPVGGGSGACGWITVRTALGRATEVWGVQSAEAPAAHDSWFARDLVERPNHTTAEGLATGAGYALTQSILRGGLDDFVLVEDAAIEEAVLGLFDAQHVLAEPAGAAALAAARQERARMAGKRVVLVVSGSNITRAQFLDLVEREQARRAG